MGLVIAVGYGMDACSSSDTPTPSASPEAGAGGKAGGGGSKSTGGSSGGSKSSGGAGMGGGGMMGGGAGGKAGGSGAGGGSGDGGGATPTCAAYCDAIMANCTGGDGSGDSGSPDATKTNQQYITKDNCLQVCKAFPVGKGGDSSGNTLGCRLTHATLAKSDPKTHCPHAGPGGAGVCGAACDGYCEIVKMFCTGDAGIYSSDAACQTRCKATTDDVPYNLGTQDGPHVACLLYHAQESPLDPADHCVGDLMPQDSGTKGSVTCQ